MSNITLDITNLLGSADVELFNKVKEIRESSTTYSEFEGKVTKSQLSISQEKRKKLFILFSLLLKDRIKESKPKLFEEEVKDIIKTNLGLQENEDISNVKDFIVDILRKSSDENTFISHMTEMESGLDKTTLSQIYFSFSVADKTHSHSNAQIDGIIKSECPIKIENQVVTNPGLALPNKRLQWNNLSDVSDLIKKETSAPDNHPLDESPLLNHVYLGQIKRIVPFGCFVRILNTQTQGYEGLVHISEMTNEREIRDSSDLISQNQNVFVQVLKISSMGKISLSIKNVDQTTGQLLSNSNKGDSIMAEKLRGRKRNRDENQSLESFKLNRRKLTSPERWEIKQLIASGAVSIDDYPELNDNIKADNQNSKITNDQNEEDICDIELNKDDRPAFLKTEKILNSTKFEMPKIVKVPRSSMNRVAMNGSNTMKEHREDKIQKKRSIEQQIREKSRFDDPTKDRRKVKEEIALLKKELTVTSWEKRKQKEHVSFGKHTSLSINEQRRKLPVYNMRHELLTAIRDNQFLVIVGETGSGKTTQITQYLNEEGFSNNGVIGCTQPRRVAAISVAKRVSEEMNSKLGEEVGYTIRFEDRTSSKTKIKYMTDGMLQREALLDPLMSKYSVIMLDEAHERTIATDILFALLKQAAAKRPELKVIVTSATLDSAKFSEYFNGCPVIKIPGKTFPVEVLYSQSPQMDYIEAALDCVMDIHINNGRGDILVFLTGQEEIDSCCEILYERVKTLGDAISELIILPVYSALPSEVQSKIFEPTPEGSRKVVFATNIAETSITIDGVYYVIDPGFAKVNTYNPRTGMEQLVVCPISQAQANQRKGRAGRTGPGKCYRLYTESAFYNEMLANTIPDIQRQNLSNTILMLKAMGINDLLNFDFMDPPPRNFMLYALNELFNLEALDSDGYITKLGQRMSQFPMEPALSRTLLASVTNKCSDEIITIIAMLSIQNVFYRPRDRQQLADSKKARFHHPYGDHLTLLNVYTQWELAGRSDQFCEANFLHGRHLRRASDVKIQINRIFRQCHIPISKCYGDPDLIRKTLVTGFFMNAAKRDSEVGYKTILGETVVGIHPSSALCGKDYDYVIYHSLVLTSREYMSQVTCINPEWLVEYAPHFYKVTDANSKSRKKAKIMPLHNRFSKDQNSWRLSSIRQTREKALGMKK